MYNKIFKNIDKFNRERRRLVVLVRYLKANVNVFLPKGEAGNTHTQHTISFGCSRFTRHFFGKSDSSAWISLSWGQQQDFEAFHGLSGKVIKHSSDFSLKLTALARRPLTSTHHLPSINHYAYSTIFISKNTLNTYFPRYVDMI